MGKVAKKNHLVFIFLISFLTFSFLSLNSAKTLGAELSLMRRWVVFPFDTDLTQKASAERAWWKTRELLTQKKKYLVASRQLLADKDVMQPRKNLKPDDVKLLGSLLEADVLVTGYSEKKQFVLNAYLTQTGGLYWSKHLNLHPSLKADDQLELTSESLTRELISNIPYQGFAVIDPLIGKPTYDESGKTFAVIDTGNTEDLSVGSDIQWIGIEFDESDDSDSQIINTIRESVLAEGKITKVKRGVAIAEVIRMKDKDSIVEKTFVRIPKEAEKLAKSFTRDNLFETKLAPELLPDNIAPVASEQKAGRRAPVIFGSIISFLGILAIAL
jgi:hypothetical protein